MNPDVIIPWGFQEAAGEFSTKDDLILVGVFVVSEDKFYTLLQDISVPHGFHT